MNVDRYEERHARAARQLRVGDRTSWHRDVDDVHLSESSRSLDLRSNPDHRMFCT